MSTKKKISDIDKAPSQDDAPARNDAIEDEALRAVLRRVYIMGW